MADIHRELKRIHRALDAADRVLSEFGDADHNVRFKSAGDPITDVDEALDAALFDAISPGRDEGWLSEETADDRARLSKSHVWIVDPLDGTKEFVDGVPEWCVSVGLIVDGVPLMGGVLSPPTGKRIIGIVGEGVTVNGRRQHASARTDLCDALVLASRSEVSRGDWDRFEDAPFRVRPMGSVALKGALVGSGEADATFTLSPKNEWDVAAASAIVRAGGGSYSTPDGEDIVFNRSDPLLSGFVAVGTALRERLSAYIEDTSSH